MQRAKKKLKFESPRRAGGSAAASPGSWRGRRQSKIGLNTMVVQRFSNRWGPTRSPFAPVFRTQLTYSDQLNVTQDTLAVPKTRLFRANGVFDPDVTGTGHQPRYYDTLCGAPGSVAPYLVSRVLASKIEVVIYPTTAGAAAGNVFASLYPTTQSTDFPSDIINMRERPDADFAYCPVLTSANPTRMSNFCKIKDVLGIKNIRDNENAAATYNNNPAQNVYWMFSFLGADQSTVATISYIVTITYYVEFSQIQNTATS